MQQDHIQKKKKKKIPSGLTFLDAGKELVKIHRLKKITHQKGASSLFVPIALNKAMKLMSSY